MLDAYLFLLSQFVPHSEHSLFFLQKLSSASACTSHRTLSQLHGTNLARDRKRRQIVIQTVLLFLLDFHQSGKVKTNFSKKKSKYALLGKSFGWVTLCFVRSDQHDEACSVISQLLCERDQNPCSTSQSTRSMPQLTLLREVIGICCKKHIASLEEQCHDSKFVIFQDRLLKVLKFYNFLWVQRRHNCSPAASFANCFKSASANVYFYINNSKMPNFELWQYSSGGAIWCTHTMCVKKRSFLVFSKWYILSLDFEKLIPWTSVYVSSLIIRWFKLTIQ